jgi:hypothetical protein
VHSRDAHHLGLAINCTQERLARFKHASCMESPENPHGLEPVKRARLRTPQQPDRLPVLSRLRREARCNVSPPKALRWRFCAMALTGGLMLRLPRAVRFAVGRGHAPAVV